MTDDVRVDSKLQNAMLTFLEHRLGGESIDKIKPAAANPGEKRADFLLDGRHVVVEMKRLSDSREKVVQEVLTQFCRDPDWPVFFGEFDLHDVLCHFPRRDDVNRELLRVVSLSIERGCAKGNEQVGETNRMFGLGDVMGVLVVLNEDVDILEPKFLGMKLNEILRRPDPAGGRMLAHIDSAIVVTWAHFVEGPDGQMLHAILSIPADDVPADEWHKTFEAHFEREWAAFLGKSLLKGGRISTPEHLDAIRIVEKRPATVFDANKRVRLPRS